MQKSEKRICFIINPAADRKRSARHIAWIQEEARKRWVSYEVIITGSRDRLDLIAAEKAQTFDIIAACGGDGTVSQIANGLVLTGTSLGVIPIGSGNDFVKSAGLNRTLPECMNILQSGRSATFDMIEYEGDIRGWCANTIGSGLDGLANFYSGRYKKLKGFIVYALGALKACFRFRGSKMRIIIDGKERKGEYLMVTLCNGKWEGGRFLMAPDAVMNDGILNLLLIKKLPVYLILAYLPLFSRGPSKYMKGISSIPCKTVEIYSDDPLYVHRDGEHVADSMQHLKLTLRERALNVIVE